MNKKQRKRALLEPQLELELGDATPAEREKMAKKFRRWARQLDVTAKILKADMEPKVFKKPYPLNKDKLEAN